MALNLIGSLQIDHLQKSWHDMTDICLMFKRDNAFNIWF